MMVDPAVAYQNYSAFNNGAEQGAFLKTENGSIYQGRENLFITFNNNLKISLQG